MCQKFSGFFFRLSVQSVSILHNSIVRVSRIQHRGLNRFSLSESEPICPSEWYLVRAWCSVGGTALCGGLPGPGFVFCGWHSLTGNTQPGLRVLWAAQPYGGWVTRPRLSVLWTEQPHNWLVFWLVSVLRPNLLWSKIWPKVLNLNLIMSKKPSFMARETEMVDFVINDIFWKICWNSPPWYYCIPRQESHLRTLFCSQRLWKTFMQIIPSNYKYERWNDWTFWITANNRCSRSGKSMRYTNSHLKRLIRLLGNEIQSQNGKTLSKRALNVYCKYFRKGILLD